MLGELDRPRICTRLAFTPWCPGTWYKFHHDLFLNTWNWMLCTNMPVTLPPKMLHLIDSRNSVLIFVSAFGTFVATLSAPGAEIAMPNRYIQKIEKNAKLYYLYQYSTVLCIVIENKFAKGKLYFFYIEKYIKENHFSHFSIKYHKWTITDFKL